MAVTVVLEKNAEIDGKPIKWYVLAITSYIGGEFQTLEIKLSKTEALMGNLLLKNTEIEPVQNSRKATEEEKEAFNEENTVDENTSFLDKLGAKKK